MASRNPAPPPLRVARFVHVAMALGLLGFSGVVVYLRLSAEEPPPSDLGRTLMIVLVALGAAELGAYFFLRRVFVTRAQMEREEALALLGEDLVPPTLNALALIGAAMAEGVGLLGVITVMLGGPWIAFAAPALAIVLILALIPVRERMELVVRGP